MKFVSREQLVDALRQLAAFRNNAKKQYAPHLLGFIALKRKNVGTAGYTPYAERDDQEFFDEFMRVADDDNPYFDPIKGFLRIRTHPHSNVSTARQRTFRAQWHAASVQEDALGAETWKLVPKKNRRIDHIIPLSAGGPDSAWNLCCSCATCNSRKGTKLPIDFSGQGELLLSELLAAR